MNQDLLNELINALTILPGVGKKSAQRMALYLLDRNKDGASILANTLTNAIESIQRCSSCRMLTSNNLCGVCSDASAAAHACARGGVSGFNCLILFKAVCERSVQNRERSLLEQTPVSKQPVERPGWWRR